MFAFLHLVYCPHQVWTALPLPLNLPFGENPVDWARPTARRKKRSFSTPEKVSCDHPIQASFIAASLLLYHFFNFRLYVKIYHATFDYSMVTKSYLQHDKGTEWSKFLQAKLPTPFCTFQCYLENQAPIIACCPFYSFHFSFQT